MVPLYPILISSLREFERDHNRRFHIPIYRKFGTTDATFEQNGEVDTWYTANRYTRSASYLCFKLPFTRHLINYLELSWIFTYQGDLRLRSRQIQNTQPPNCDSKLPTVLFQPSQSPQACRAPLFFPKALRRRWYCGASLSSSAFSNSTQQFLLLGRQLRAVPHDDSLTSFPYCSPPRNHLFSIDIPSRSTSNSSSSP